MINIKVQSGELRATIHVTRKATGKVETYELTARTTPEQHARIMHGASGALVGPGSEMNNQPKEE